jgi:oligopeptide/dipeptide ABC transporter ATP-binding protein
MERNVLLKIQDLKTRFTTDGAVVKAVDGVSLDVFEGEVLGIVGESGSGKSVTALSILRLIPSPPGEIAEGRILFQGEDILAMDWDEVHHIRGNRISMIFQEPMTSLNPVLTVGDQIAEVLVRHKGMDKKAASDESARMLGLVGIPDAAKRLADYPHQFSGGMRQRVMIAMALSCDPLLLIADEPTTALDVTIQAQILDLMLDLKNRKKDAAVMLITHNLAVVAETCDRVAVMYCGLVQETADVKTLFESPAHPYTVGLMKSIPSLETREKRLVSIPGNVPSMLDLPAGCPFHPRCPRRMPVCETAVPPLFEMTEGHSVRCYLYAGNPRA